MKNALCAAWRLYKTNFAPLMKLMLVQLILRAMALTPLLFLAEKSTAPLAWLAVPAYLLIVPVARQNVALAMADLLHGGSVFSLRLLETADYGKKLLRGLRSLLFLLLWSSVTIAGGAWLYRALTDAAFMDGFTLLRIFSSAGKLVGGSTPEGALLIVGAIAATGVLTLVGCAVHSGARHAEAQGGRWLLRRKRGGLIGLWMLSLLLLVPFVAALALIMGDWAISALRQFMNTFEFAALSVTGRQWIAIAVSAAALLTPVIPLRTLLSAVYLRGTEE